MSWKVLITARAFSEVGRSAAQLLEQAGCKMILPPKLGPQETSELILLLESTDAVLADLDRFSEAVLESPAAANLKIISRWGVGYDAVDVKAATRLGIVVANTPGLLNEAVADYAFALLMTAARRLHEADASMRKGSWELLWGAEISGSTLGIIGCGRIGQAVARRASGFNMRILGYDPTAPKEVSQLGIKLVSLDELLAESDFVTLHAALTPQSRGLISERELRKMKRSAYLINTARGALIDEAAVARALLEGWIAGAALDTFVEEPLPAQNPLRKAPNILLAPHLASFGRGTGERVTLAAANAIINLMRGQRPASVVNEDVLQSPALRTKIQ